MGLTAAALRKLAEFGLTIDQVVEVAAAMEEGARARTANAERQARFRARKAESVTSNVTNNAGTPSSSLSSPTPPSNLTPSPTTHKEKTPKGVQKKASRLPADWVLPEDWRQDAITAGLPPQQIDREAEKMRDWSVNSAKGAKLDWRAAWRNWCREAADRRPQARGSPQREPGISELAFRLAANMDQADGRQNADRELDWETPLGLPAA